MSMVSLDSTNIGRVLARPGLLLVEWWAKWCSPYQVFGSLESWVGRSEGLTLARVDVDAQPELAGVMGVQVMPTLMLFRDGFLLLNHVGSLPEPVLEDLLRQARALDMEEVRRRRGTPHLGRARVRVGPLREVSPGPRG